MMFDTHVHAGPCVTERLLDDVDTVAAYEAAGFDGCVLKGHCESTVGRAATAGKGRRIAVYGGIVLNHVVGGLNPAAAVAALSLGARVVWLPTVDALAHRQASLSHPPSCTPALGEGPSYAAPPLDPSTADPLRTVFRAVAEHDAVLATGHLGAAELEWVVPEALAAGVRRVLLTHPSFTVPAMTAERTRALCELGAVAEITAYQLLHQPDCDATRLAAFVRDVGPEHCLLSSDAGQPTSPPAPQALEQLVEALAAEGVDRGALRAMAGDIPAALVSPR
jgi:hypothetical protein